MVRNNWKGIALVVIAFVAPQLLWSTVGINVLKDRGQTRNDRFAEYVEI